MCILYVTLAQLVERTPFTYHTTHDATYIDVLYARVRVCMSNASQRSAGCSLREDSVWSRVRAPYVIFLVLNPTTICIKRPIKNSFGRRDRCRAASARVGNKEIHRRSLAIDASSRVYAPSPSMDDPSRSPRVEATKTRQWTPRARAATTATSGVETHYLEGLECRCAFHQRRGESSSGTRAEQTNTRERPPREQRIAGLAGQLDRIVDDIGVLNDELETKESEFGALALIVRAMPMPKKRKRAVESPTSYEDVFERAKFPAYVTPAQKRVHPGRNQHRTRARNTRLVSFLDEHS